MKSCIWNDRCYKLIKEGELYDAVEFTVVRKLFFRWFVDGPITLDEISSAFGSFGEIESIESVNDEATEDGEFPVTHEAYVTFVQSEDAYETLTSLRFPINLLYFVPADTWHQPDYKESDNIIVGISGDHKCGMDSITREFSILSLNQNSNEVLCENTSLTFKLELKSGTTLDGIRKTLRGMMPFVGDLTLDFNAEFDDYPEADDVHYVGRGPFFGRVTEVIGKNARGPNLKVLKIDGLVHVPQMMLRRLAPVLEPITDLTIFTEYCNILYLLPSLSPNLTSLHLVGDKWEGDGDDVSVQPWPTLKELVVGDISLDVDSDTDTGKRFRHFVSLNPQLETLDMHMIVNNSLLKEIVESVRNLKSSKLARESFNGVGGMIDELVRLEHLESIYVNTVHLTTNHFKSLISFVECLSKKNGLQMAALVQNYVLDENESDVINAAVPIKYHHDCSCHDDNRAITFNDESQNDVVILPKHKAALAILVNVARHLKIADDTLDSCIHAMFKDTEKFYPTVLKTTVVEEPERFVYIHISSL